MPDRVALVTGASRGIGRAVAMGLGKQGHRVAVNYHEDDVAAKVTVGEIERFGGTAVAVQADVSDRQGVDHLFDEVERQLGPVGILVNNAGTRMDGLCVTMTDEAWDRVIETNLFGTFACCRRALKPMLKARWGRIVNITSAIALKGNPGQVNYAAAKAGQIGLTKTLAREVAARGINVNAVAPGLIATELTLSLPESRFDQMVSEIPMGRAGTPREAAEIVLFLASEESAYITGSVFVVDGGMTS